MASLIVEKSDLKIVLFFVFFCSWKFFGGREEKNSGRQSQTVEVPTTTTKTYHTSPNTQHLFRISTPISTMSSNLPYKQAANVERRTWDKETYEARAKARLTAENSSDGAQKRPLPGSGVGVGSDNAANANDDDATQPAEKEEFQQADAGAQGPMNSKRAFLKARRGKVDLDSKVGTSEIIHPDAVAASSSATDDVSVSITDGVTKTGVGWHCKVCDCFLKDSMTYLDHINGRKHQRTLGYSMRIAKSTTNEVVSKLDQLAKQQKAKETEEILNEGKEDEEDANAKAFQDIVKKKDDEIEERKADRKRRREERKKKVREEAEKKESEGEEEEDEDDGVNPDMAAMMGFSGFG